MSYCAWSVSRRWSSCEQKEFRHTRRFKRIALDSLPAAKSEAKQQKASTLFFPFHPSIRPSSFRTPSAKNRSHDGGNIWDWGSEWVTGSHFSGVEIFSPLAWRKNYQFGKIELPSITLHYGRRSWLGCSDRDDQGLLVLTCIDGSMKWPRRCPRTLPPDNNSLLR